jgi:hypothetical protein
MAPDPGGPVATAAARNVWGWETQGAKEPGQHRPSPKTLTLRGPQRMARETSSPTLHGTTGQGPSAHPAAKGADGLVQEPNLLFLRDTTSPREERAHPATEGSREDRSTIILLEYIILVVRFGEVVQEELD